MYWHAARWGHVDQIPVEWTTCYANKPWLNERPLVTDRPTNNTHHTSPRTVCRETLGIHDRQQWSKFNTVELAILSSFMQNGHYINIMLVHEDTKDAFFIIRNSRNYVYGIWQHKVRSTQESSGSSTAPNTTRLSLKNSCWSYWV